MATETTQTLNKLFKNRFVLGMLVGFAIGTATKSIFVGIVLIAVLAMAWYGASKKKSTAEEPVEVDE